MDSKSRGEVERSQKIKNPLQCGSTFPPTFATDWLNGKKLLDFHASLVSKFTAGFYTSISIASKRVLSSVSYLRMLLHS